MFFLERKSFATGKLGNIDCPLEIVCLFRVKLCLTILSLQDRVTDDPWRERIVLAVTEKTSPNLQGLDRGSYRPRVDALEPGCPVCLRKKRYRK